MENGADVNFYNKEKNTALTQAVDTKYQVFGIVKFLLEKGADVHHKNKANKDALAITVSQPSSLLINVKDLVKFGADVKRPGLLTAAVEAGGIFVVQFLIENGCDVNEIFEGNTPLSKASKMGYVDMIKILLKYGADVNLKTTEGVTALMMATQAEQPMEIVKILLKRGASINSVDKCGRSVLTHCYMGPKDDQAKEKLASYLIREGAVVDVIIMGVL